MFKDDQEDPERVGLMSGLIPTNNRKSPFLGEDLAFPIPNFHMYTDIHMIYGNIWKLFCPLGFVSAPGTSN
jgi:hypothetical protein